MPIVLCGLRSCNRVCVCLSHGCKTDTFLKYQLYGAACLCCFVFTENFCLSFAGRFEAYVEMIIRVHLLADSHSIREDLKQRAVYLIFM